MKISVSRRRRRVRAPLNANQRLLAVGLVLGVTLVAFEITAVITALPTITDELGGDSLYGVALASLHAGQLVALGRRRQARRPQRADASRSCSAIATFIAGLVVAGTRRLDGRRRPGPHPAGRRRRRLRSRRLRPREASVPGRPSGDDVRHAVGGLGAAEPARPRLRRRRDRTVRLAMGVPRHRAVRRDGRRDRQPADDAPTARPADDETASPRRLAYAFGAAAGVGDHGHRPAVDEPGRAGRRGTVGGVALAVPMLRRLMPRGFFTRPRGFAAVLACRVLRHGDVPRRRQLRAARRRPDPRRDADGAGLRHHRRGADAWTVGPGDHGSPPTSRRSAGAARVRAALSSARCWSSRCCGRAGRCGSTFLSWPVGGLGHGHPVQPDDARGDELRRRRSRGQRQRPGAASPTRSASR